MKRLLFATAGLFLLALSPAQAAVCPTPIIPDGEAASQNWQRNVQAVLEKICANLDTLVAGGSGAGTGDVNLKQVGGATVKTGAGTASGAQRVELPTDGTGKVGLIAGGALIGKVDVNGANKNTYGVTAIGYTAYSTPTDMVCLTGSASKTIRVVQFGIRIQSTSAALQTIYFIKRSTANSGGTSTNPTPVAHDSTNAAATAVPIVYTAAPTTGSAVGTVQVVFVLSATLTAAPGLVSVYTTPTPAGLTEYRQTLTLRGTAESLCINYNGANLTSGFAAEYEMVWTEE